ncbi:TPA: LOW QUALITY PROTEIN: hypothetical protein N0F65_005520 [Lagenidium giganteum]|uniref:Aminotransferase class I/classII large domain-containing protein n=1 Tax=Lagenidium giganteum TaxID=4803 RepID=A0AAV2YCK7_9STRA|nr:TPA: LOW QUALITY PROTEIN: hypothetical protein N0F65_005520 [Lagenidium giganteum]
MVRDETDLVQANYVPLSPDYVSQLIAMTVEESDLASQDNSYDSTGLTVLGWRDRRKVEKSAVRFVMSKQFPHIRANDLMTNTWNRITNPKTYPTFFSPALVIKMVVVQRIDDNTMVIYRSIYNPQSSKIGRSLEVMGRVWRGDECLIFTRSVDCPNLRALFGEVNSWSQVITWLRFAVPETNANGCDFEYGGCYGNVVAAGIMYWLMEVLFIVLRSHPASTQRWVVNDDASDPSDDVAKAGLETPAITTGVSGIGDNVFAEISLLAAKHGAVNLGQGFPSFHTPSFVKQAAIDAINANHNQYTRPGGQVDYVNVLADMYSPLLDRRINPMTEVVTFNGAQEGITAILAALVEPGDEVLTLEPYFDAYKTVSTLLGIKTVGLPLEMSPEKKKAYNSDSTNSTFSSADFHIDVEKLDHMITPKTKMLVLNTPHNPTGKVLTKQELEDIARVLQRHPHVIVLSDEVYEFMTFDGKPHERIAAYSGMFDRTISLFSAGKTFSCTGWRAGYAICPEHLSKPITKAHSTIPFCGVTPFEVALASCFKQVETNGYLQSLASDLERRRDRLVKALQEAGWRPIVPEGGYFVCCNVASLPSFQEFKSIKITKDLPKKECPDYQFAYKTCKEAKLAVIPTSPFFTKPEHQLAPGLVRLAYCKDDETLDSAVKIISALGAKN